MDDHLLPQPKPLESLSQRERDILALLAEDLSNRQIAAHLVLAPTTVKWYNRQIFNKLGVENRQQAVERGFALGLLRPSDSTRSPARSLPVEITPFIGRVSELEDLTRLLSHPNTRLVTILALGGMGKTRLAQAAAQSLTGQFAHGIHFVPLTPLTSSEQLVPTMADAVGFRFSPDTRTPQQQLLDFLRSKQVLLLIDNFEHLLEGATLMADILQAAPQVKLLITSRERLNLDGETVYGLGGMPYPDPNSAEHVLDYGAVQLFIECARRANAHFVAEDERSIVRICRAVQGMPLALELAAAWVGMLSPAEIAEEIVRSADFLVTTAPNVPERLRSVRTVFEATWRRLTEDERRVFRRLSVFRGGCTREAAQVICGDNLRLLSGLVGKALLWYSPETRRYTSHELLRQYAAEQLVTSGEAETIWKRYRDYFGKFSSQWGKALKTAQQATALAILEADFDNIREAFRRAIDNGSLDEIEPFTDLWHFYNIRARNVEGETTFGAALEKLNGTESVALGKLLGGRSLFLLRLGQWQQAQAEAERSLDLLRRLAPPYETFRPLFTLHETFLNQGDLAHAKTLAQEAFDLARSCDDEWAESVALYKLGWTALHDRQLDDVRDFLSQALVLSTKRGDASLMSYVFRDLIDIAYESGDYDEADRLAARGLVNAKKNGDLVMVGDLLFALRLTALAKGDLLLAQQFGEDHLSVARDTGSPWVVFIALSGLAEVAVASGSQQQARQHLREALTTMTEVNDLGFVKFVGAATAQFLAQIDASSDAVYLLSFLDHHPMQRYMSGSTMRKLQALSAQLQSEMPAEVYTLAWERGRTLTLDDVLTRLHVLT